MQKGTISKLEGSQCPECGYYNMEVINNGSAYYLTCECGHEKEVEVTEEEE